MEILRCVVLTTSPKKFFATLPDCPTPRLPDFGTSARCPIMNERFQIVEWFKVTFFLMSSDFQLFCRYLSN